MSGLLHTAKLLAEVDPERPTDANLRRAVSTAYYAVFEALADSGADTLIGQGRRPRPAWLIVHRALEHGRAREALRRIIGAEWSEDAQRIAAGFVRLQGQRHGADYDPGVVFNREDARASIEEAESVIAALSALDAEERTLLVVQVLFRPRQ